MKLDTYSPYLNLRGHFLGLQARQERIHVIIIKKGHNWSSFTYEYLIPIDK